LPPVVYDLESEFNLETFQRVYRPVTSEAYPVRFFVRGAPYQFLGLFETDLHLFGAPGGGVIYLMGTDQLGRDIFSRVVYGARVSFSLGLVCVALSLALGMLFGGVSGYSGGLPDLLIQRAIEILRSFPSIPLWIALAAALPVEWSPILVYFGITVILSM